MALGFETYIRHIKVRNGAEGGIAEQSFML
jgi:hypothetical protein